MNQFVIDGNHHNDSNAYVAVSSYTGEISGLQQDLNDFYTQHLSTEDIDFSATSHVLVFSVAKLEITATFQKKFP